MFWCDRTAYLLHGVERSWGETMQFIRVDEAQALMADCVQIGPLLPVAQSVRILTPARISAGLALITCSRLT